MEITPESAGWTYLSFAIVGLKPGERHDHLLTDQETAVVPISGSATVKVGDIETTLSRTSVFEEMPRIAYAPPGVALEIVAIDEAFEFAIGSAPAEGRYPARIIEPADMSSELRGAAPPTARSTMCWRRRSMPSDSSSMRSMCLVVRGRVGRRTAMTVSTVRRIWRRRTTSDSTHPTASVCTATGGPTRISTRSSRPATAIAPSSPRASLDGSCAREPHVLPQLSGGRTRRR